MDIQTWQKAAVALVAAGSLGMLAACGGNGPRALTRYEFPPRSLDAELLFQRPEPPRELRMFSGQERARLVWEDVEQALVWAEVVLVEDLSDNMASNSFEVALVEDALEAYPWTNTSLGVLDRNQQNDIFGFILEKLSEQELREALGSTPLDPNTMGILRMARERRTKVLAPGAAPQMLAMVEGQGIEALGDVEKPARGLFSRPQAELLEHAIRTASAVPRDEDAQEIAEGKDQEAAMFAVKAVDAATMADTIVQGLETSNPRVIHIGGSDTVALDGMMVQEILARRPNTKILTISLVPEPAENLRVEEFGIADIVVYTEY